MRQIHHDPFARFTLVRRTVTGARGCAWCGTVRYTKNNRPTLYNYGTSRDDRDGVDWDTRDFCSLPCRKAYTG